VCVLVCSWPWKCPFRARFPQLRVPQSCCGAEKQLKRLHCSCSLMLQSGALAAEDMRQLWGLRTVITGSNSPGTVIMCSSSSIKTQRIQIIGGPTGAHHYRGLEHSSQRHGIVQGYVCQPILQHGQGQGRRYLQMGVRICGAMMLQTGLIAQTTLSCAKTTGASIY